MMRAAGNENGGGRGPAGRAAVGAIAGCIAAAPMLVLLRCLREPQLAAPPHRVAMGVTRLVVPPDRLRPSEQRAVTLFGHYGFGAAAGILHGLLPPTRPTVAAARGSAIGVAVWAASYVGWIPASGILPPPHRRPLRENVSLVAGHLLWGALAGAIVSRFDDQR